MSPLKLSTDSVKGALQNAVLFLSAWALDLPEIQTNLVIGLIFNAFTGIAGISDYPVSFTAEHFYLECRTCDFPVHGAQSRHLAWRKVFSLGENCSLCARM